MRDRAHQHRAVRRGGSATSSTRAELAVPGATVRARIRLIPRSIGSAIACGLRKHAPVSDKPRARGKVPRDGTKAHPSAFSLPHARNKRRRQSRRGEVDMEPIGRKRWAIAEGYIPSQSSFSDRTLISHETACILNAGDQAAHVDITIFFADREPIGPYRVTVRAAAHAAFALQRSQRSRGRSPRHRLFIGVRVRCADHRPAHAT